VRDDNAITVVTMWLLWIDIRKMIEQQIHFETRHRTTRMSGIRNGGHGQYLTATLFCGFGQFGFHRRIECGGLKSARRGEIHDSLLVSIVLQQVE
jgi:hypothetical protein